MFAGLFRFKQESGAAFDAGVVRRAFGMECNPAPAIGALCRSALVALHVPAVEREQRLALLLDVVLDDPRLRRLEPEVHTASCISSVNASWHFSHTLPADTRSLSCSRLISRFRQYGSGSLQQNVFWQPNICKCTK